MTARTALVRGFARIRERPATLAVGVALGAVQSVVVAAAGIAGGQFPLLPDYVAVTLVVLSPAFTTPLLAGLYAQLTDEEWSGKSHPRNATVRASVRVAAGAVRRTYRRLLVASLVATGVALGLALAGWGVLFVLNTGVRWVRYQVLTPGYPYLQEPLVTQMGTFFLALGLSRLAVRFADVAVLFDDVSPTRGWLASVRTVREEPVSILGYGAVVATLTLGSAFITGLVRSFARTSVLPGLVGESGGTFGAPEPAVVLWSDVVGLLAGTVLGGLALTVACAFHVSFYRSVLVPREPPNVKWPAATHQDDPVTPIPWRRVAVVTTVLVGAVVGAGVVRTVDPHPAPERRSLPDDPVAAYGVAAENTRGLNHRTRLQQRNVSDPDGEWRTISRSGIDHRDRQFYVYLSGGDGTEVGGYYGEGALAIRNSGGYGGLPVVRDSENWTLLPLPGFATTVGSDPPGNLPPNDLPWQVAHQNESTLVLRVDRGPLVREAFGPYGVVGLGPNQTEAAFVSVTIDRERGVVDHVTAALHSRETGHHFRYVVDFRQVGTADLERPAALGPRHAVEWLWDACYY